MCSVRGWALLSSLPSCLPLPSCMCPHASLHSQVGLVPLTPASCIGAGHVLRPWVGSTRIPTQLSIRAGFVRMPLCILSCHLRPVMSSCALEVRWPTAYLPTSPLKKSHENFGVHPSSIPASPLDPPHLSVQKVSLEGSGLPECHGYTSSFDYRAHAVGGSVPISSPTSHRPAPQSSPVPLVFLHGPVTARSYSNVVRRGSLKMSGSLVPGSQGQGSLGPPADTVN